MRSIHIVVLLCCVVVQACCVLQPHRHRHGCHAHPEPPFILPKSGPNPGLVFGTADFDAKGVVLIKLQVEDLTTILGRDGTITAWSGNGDPPADASVIPPLGGTEVYNSGGDVSLRHWTTHIDRSFEPAVDHYWVLVRVNHNTPAGRDVDYLWWEWLPSSETGFDTPHDFNQY